MKSSRSTVVFGGTGVLGREMASALLEDFERVIVVGRDASKLKSLDLPVETLVCDYTDAGLQVTASEICANGVPAVLVFSVGGNRPSATLGPNSSFGDLDLEAMREVFELNLTTAFVSPLHAFSTYLETSSESVSVIGISSASSGLPLTRVGAYGAAKAALVNFIKWSAVELGRRTQGRIRVNAIEPGFFLTEQNRYLLIGADGEPTERAKSILAHTPSGRFGDPSDLRGAVRFLASEQASFVTGSVLTVDGGFTAWWGV